LDHAFVEFIGYAKKKPKKKGQKKREETPFRLWVDDDETSVEERL